MLHAMRGRLVPLQSLEEEFGEEERIALRYIAQADWLRAYADDLERWARQRLVAVGAARVMFAGGYHDEAGCRESLPD